jgi:hypothetical protein
LRRCRSGFVLPALLLHGLELVSAKDAHWTGALTAGALCVAREQTDCVTPVFDRFSDTVARFVSPVMSLPFTPIARVADRLYGRGGRKWPNPSISYGPAQPRVAWISSVGYRAYCETRERDRKVIDDDVRAIITEMGERLPGEQELWLDHHMKGGLRVAEELRSSL